MPWITGDLGFGVMGERGEVEAEVGGLEPAVAAATPLISHFEQFK